MPSFLEAKTPRAIYIIWIIDFLPLIHSIAKKNHKIGWDHQTLDEYAYDCKNILNMISI